MIRYYFIFNNMSSHQAEISSNSNNHKSFFGTILFSQIIILGIFIIIFFVSAIGWRSCSGMAYCKNGEYPIGPIREGTGEIKHLTCCKTNQDLFICNGEMVTYEKCSKYNDWMWTFFGNFIGFGSLSILIWLIYGCVLFIRKF